MKKSKGVKIKINLFKVGLAVLIILACVPFVLAFLQTEIDNSQIDLSQALSDIKSDKVDKVNIEGNKLIFSYKDGTTKIATKEETISFPDLLDKAKFDQGK